MEESNPIKGENPKITSISLIQIAGKEYTFNIPLTEADKLSQVLYILCLDNKIEATLIKN